MGKASVHRSFGERQLDVHTFLVAARRMDHVVLQHYSATHIGSINRNHRLREDRRWHRGLDHRRDGGSETVRGTTVVFQSLVKRLKRRNERRVEW